MLLQVDGAQVPEPAQAPARVLAAFVAAALVLPLRYLGNLGPWLDGAVKMNDTVVVGVVVEHDPLRLPAHARLAAVGDHAVRPVRDHLHQPYGGQIVEIRLSAGGQECMVVKLDGEMPCCRSPEWFVGSTPDAMIYDRPQRGGHQGRVPGNRLTGNHRGAGERQVAA